MYAKYTTHALDRFYVSIVSVSTQALMYSFSPLVLKHWKLSLSLPWIRVCVRVITTMFSPSEQFWRAAAVSVQPLVTLVSTLASPKRLSRKIAFWSLWHANDWAICWRQQAVELRTDAYECRSDVGLLSHFIRQLTIWSGQLPKESPFCLSLLLLSARERMYILRTDQLTAMLAE